MPYPAQYYIKIYSLDDYWLCSTSNKKNFKNFRFSMIINYGVARLPVHKNWFFDKNSLYHIPYEGEHKKFWFSMIIQYATTHIKEHLKNFNSQSWLIMPNSAWGYIKFEFLIILIYASPCLRVHKSSIFNDS